MSIEFDKYSETKAVFIQAHNGDLPVNFDQWELVTHGGWTVAHEATQWDHLPDHFDRWGLTDDNGLSVLGYFLMSQTSHTDPSVEFKFMSKWSAEKPLCKTEADWDVFRTELPEIYRKYAIIGIFDDVTQQICFL
jgi:hypothetical protein